VLLETSNVSIIKGDSNQAITLATQWTTIIGVITPIPGVQTDSIWEKA